MGPRGKVPSVHNPNPIFRGDIRTSLQNLGSNTTWVWVMGIIIFQIHLFHNQRTETSHNFSPEWLGLSFSCTLLVTKSAVRLCSNSMMIQKAYRTPNIAECGGCESTRRNYFQLRFEPPHQAELHHPMSQSLLAFRRSTRNQFLSSCFWSLHTISQAHQR